MKRIQKRKLALQPLTLRKLERVRGGVGLDEAGGEDGIYDSRNCPSIMTCDPNLA